MMSTVYILGQKDAVETLKEHRLVFCSLYKSFLRMKFVLAKPFSFCYNEENCPVFGLLGGFFMENSRIFMYVSQWAFKLGEPGLSLYTFDTNSGEIQFVRRLDEKLSFGCSLVDEKKQLIYLCNECDLFPEVPYNTGRVYCYSIDAVSGELTLVNRRETYSPFTSYLNTDSDGKYLMVSNHSMNNYSTTAEVGTDGVIRPVLHHHDSLMNLFALNEDGSIGDMVDISNHKDDNELHLSLIGEPAIPHPHCVMRSPSGKLYACCDKGDGHIYIYTIADGKLKLLSRTLTDTPYSEPRYCAFHPTLPYLYVNHEHTPGDKITLTAFRYDEDGQLTKIGTLYADTEGFEPKEKHRQQQGMCISPDGRFVYTQVHGYNLLLVLAVDETSGLLKQVQALPIEGSWPRSLNLSPDGKFLINCCLGGEIIVYGVGEDGILTDSGYHSFLKGAGYVSFFDPHK